METYRSLPPRAARHPRSARRRALTVLAAAALAVGAMWGWLHTGSGAAANSPSLMQRLLVSTQPQPTTVLVLGAQQGGGEPPLTDSIMLVALDPKGNEAGMLS